MESSSTAPIFFETGALFGGSESSELVGNGSPFLGKQIEIYARNSEGKTLLNRYIPGNLFAKFQTSFYSDSVGAMFKAIGVE